MPAVPTPVRVRTVLAAAGIAAGTVLATAPAAQAWTLPAPHLAVTRAPAATTAPHLAHRQPEHRASRSARRHDRRHHERRHHTGRHHHGSRGRHHNAHHHAAAHHHHRRKHHAGAHRHHAIHRHHVSARYAYVSRHLTRVQQINRVIAVARAQRGKPYRWGAAGPHAFDCSGFVQWVYRHALGRHLPKYTDTQFDETKHIHHLRNLRRGDLVFVRVGGHEEHVGIYAGHWHWWVAPHTGSHVKYQHIYPARHVYSRVIP